LTESRQTELSAFVALLRNARETLTPLESIPDAIAPTTDDEALWVQTELAAAFGPIGGWKVGAGTPTAIPACGPIPFAWLHPSASTIPNSRFRGLEAEVAFLLGSDLPPRATPYADAEVLAAIASCHPAIEILESAFPDPTTVPKLIGTADLQNHGGFVYGPAYPDWQPIDFTQETVVLSINGTEEITRTGSNTSGNLLRLLPWLANQSARTGGLRAGQWITTGSWTGALPAPALATAEVRFGTLGSVTLTFV
jgi:2-keto-4-pentenoate hydratase